MNVLISVLKKDGGKFEKAVDFNPALMSLGETVQDVLANATFHEWGSVLVEFDYKEKGAHTEEQEAEKEYANSELREVIDARFKAGAAMDAAAKEHFAALAEMEKGFLGIPPAADKFCPVHGPITDGSKPCAKGIPADSVAFTKPPEFV